MRYLVKESWTGISLSDLAYQVLPTVAHLSLSLSSLSRLYKEIFWRDLVQRWVKIFTEIVLGDLVETDLAQRNSLKISYKHAWTLFGVL